MDTVTWLLGKNMDIESVSNAGCNSAVWAAAAGRIEMCEFLLGRGADFHKVNFWGHGVVSKASWHGHTELLKWLFDTAGVANQLFIVNHVGEVSTNRRSQCCGKLGGAAIRPVVRSPLAAATLLAPVADFAATCSIFADSCRAREAGRALGDGRADARVHAEVPARLCADAGHPDRAPAQANEARRWRPAPLQR